MAEGGAGVFLHGGVGAFEFVDGAIEVDEGAVAVGEGVVEDGVEPVPGRAGALCAVRVGVDVLDHDLDAVLDDVLDFAYYCHGLFVIEVAVL